MGVGVPKVSPISTRRGYWNHIHNMLPSATPKWGSAVPSRRQLADFGYLMRPIDARLALRISGDAAAASCLRTHASSKVKCYYVYSYLYILDEGYRHF